MYKYVKINYISKPLALLISLILLVSSAFYAYSSNVSIFNVKDIINHFDINSSHELSRRSHTNYSTVCTVPGGKFLLHAAQAKRDGRDETNSIIQTFGDHYLTEIEGALIFLDGNKADAFVFNKKDKLYIDEYKCLPSDTAKIVINKTEKYTDVLIR